MSGEENKALVRRMYEETDFGAGTLGDVFAPNLKAHIAGAPPVDRESFQQDMQMFYTAFSDFSYTFENLVAEGDKVAVRVTIQATHTADFMGLPATGKQISVTSTGIARIQDGQIAEWWNSPDRLGLMQQLGLLPPPQSGS
jgi:steroid delta-isomerase-like uncharacterized protein